MKEYYNKNLDFKFYTNIEFEDDGSYRLWICDSNQRICDYYSSDVILYFAKLKGVDEEEMQELLAKDLKDTKTFETFISCFCTTYDYAEQNSIDKILSSDGLLEDYNGLTIDEKIKKWYGESDFANIFGNYLVELY